MGHEFCSYFLQTSQLKTRSTDSTEKLTIDTLLKEFSAFYKNESSKSVHIGTPPLFYPAPQESISRLSIYVSKFILILSFHYAWFFKVASFLQVLRPNISPISLVSSACHKFHPFETPWFESPSCCSSPKARFSLSLSEISIFWLWSQPVLNT